VLQNEVLDGARETFHRFIRNLRHFKADCSKQERMLPASREQSSYYTSKTHFLQVLIFDSAALTDSQQKPRPIFKQLDA
jgi:hypothetical protein